MYAFRYNLPLPVHSQIAQEIEYFRAYYAGLHPTVFLAYEREAYYSLDGGEFRVTFDENILYREYNFSLGSKVSGTPLLAEGQTLMEIKTAGGLPLWMSRELNRLRVYPASFSKYGAAYRQMMARTQRDCV